MFGFVCISNRNGGFTVDYVNSLNPYFKACEVMLESHTNFGVLKDTRDRELVNFDFNMFANNRIVPTINPEDEESGYWNNPQGQKISSQNL